MLAVVPDFTIDTIARPVPPTVYSSITDYSSLVFVRLDGNRLRETLDAIDDAWKRTGGREPPVRNFLDELLQKRYVDILRQSQAFGVCASIAVLLACVGLYGITASAAQRRTREIAFARRWARGTSSVVRRLLWQFTLPVFWATPIAWITAAWLMQRWLEGFAYHAPLPLWLFPAAAGAALLIAIATVCGHALAVGRVRPIAGLRHE